MDHEAPLVDLNRKDISDLIDPDALDPEGVAVDRAGNFWLCEEFRPSIFMAAPDGTVLLRLVPEGTLCGGEVIPTFDVLPRVFAKRITNRGFEDVALTRNGFLYAIMQSPLANPGRSQRDTSRNLRILRLDLQELLAENPAHAMRQYLYITEPAVPGRRQRDVTVSSLFSLTPSLFVSAERGTAKVFVFNLARRRRTSAASRVPTASCSRIRRGRSSSSLPRSSPPSESVPSRRERSSPRRRTWTRSSGRRKESASSSAPSF